jgi:hypothetical protein
VNRVETAANVAGRVQRVALTDTDDQRGEPDLAFDQPGPATDSLGRAQDQLPGLQVDPAFLGRTARLLDELPGPHSPTIAVPTAEAIGATKLATATHAFHRRYREAAGSLAVDNDTTAANLAHAADAYRSVEAHVTALLTEAAALLSATPRGATSEGDPPDSASPDCTAPDGAELDRTEPHRTEPDSTAPGSTASGNAEPTAPGTDRRIRDALEV